MAALLLFSIVSFFSTAVIGMGEGGADADCPSREFFRFHGDVAWVVQVSDLHLSAYHPERGSDLLRLLAPALGVIRPSLLLITGDITDAKNERRSSARQDESEWTQYRNAMDAIVGHNYREKRRIFDIRGNHDKYGVPYVGHNLDFFSIYSINSQLNRHNTINSISLVGENRIYHFLGIDDTIGNGIRWPSNLFGHPTDRTLDAVESELQYWDSLPGGLVTKVVFGHFPTSFAASSKRGRRYEGIFARQSVSAYICGHLHAKLGKTLWRLHMIDFPSGPNGLKHVGQFWEWELGDWKESRLMRILAIDGGAVSFLDIGLSSQNQLLDDFQTTILITHPTDSRCMNQDEMRNPVVRNDINSLVFSVQPIRNVTARVFDSSRAFKIVEEIPLQPVTGSVNFKPLFHAKWNAENYKSMSASRLWLQVFVTDDQGKETASAMRPFSVEGKLAYHPSTLLVYMIFNVHWEDLYLFLLWSNICFLILLLFLPKLLNYFMERNEPYQKWAMSISVSSPIRQKKFIFSLVWFLLEGSRSRKFWLAMVFYLLYLLKMPWFSGHATSENGDIAKMYMRGWSIQTPSASFIKEEQGYPDIMTITLPFMYLAVTPIFLLIYGLFAKSSGCHLYYHRKISCAYETSPRGQGQEFVRGAPPKYSLSVISSWIIKFDGDWTRRALLLACLIISLLHLKICSVLMAAYGVGPVALSPALAWAPQLFLAAAIFGSKIDLDMSLHVAL
ncbi:putative calcineurin-like phosphoesterase domain, ApaH type, metallo-dependent phosphatase [Dioscorea sansibarensis]